MTEEAATLPQQATPSSAVVTSVEWLFEPAWRGERLMASARDGAVTLSDRHGRPAEVPADAARVLASALDAGQALIDGVWTAMAFPGEPSGEPDGATPPVAPRDRRPMFVALDLVELDGQPLHDVPYLERRRLLGSVLREDARVRISPAVRVPAERWLAAWRAEGFRHYLAKHANSRYRPGQRSEQWLKIPSGARGGPGLLGRLLGSRPRRVPYIRDEPPGG